MKNNDAHTKRAEELIGELKSSSAGLSDDEAEKRNKREGDNVLSAGKKHGLLYRFFRQFADLMIVILLVAAVISFVMAATGNGDILEPFIIVSIVFVNAALGTAQEYKAEKSLSRLASLAAPQCKVMRNGRVKKIDNRKVTVGDVVLLEAGDVVPADARLTESVDLKINEASLTGESLPVEKNAKQRLSPETPLAERVNCVYSGSFVESGRGKAVVYAVGQRTELGKIAELLSSTEKAESPIEVRLASLSKTIGILCVAVCLAVLALGTVKGIKNMQEGGSVLAVFMNIFLTSVSLAVAAIPEGLPAVVTIVLSRGVERMAKKNAIVKTLPAVETLGSATVICSDKTGTLTQNKMAVDFLFDGKTVCAADRLNDGARRILRDFALCCDVQKNEKGEYLGDPTEIAAVELCDRCGVDLYAERLFELPFSQRKMMTVVVKTEGKTLAITKGSLENMAKIAQNGGKFALYNDKFAKNGLRVLAVAEKEVDAGGVRDPEKDLNIIGLVAMSDPLRENVKRSVAICKEAGIRPVMITGDNVDTACEIARQAGIFQAGDRAVTGSQLEKMSDRELADAADTISVYARVTPRDKLRIVSAWQARGEVVAMTGDGVNDAPALKRADIGCAMGKSGTEVAKSTADMILTDDDFSTIVEAVAEGRGVFDNVKKAVRYLLSCNIGEVLSVFLLLLFGSTAPFSAMQLLWINLVTDGLPSIALGMEEKEADVMKRKPKKRTESFFSGGGRAIFFYGVLFALATAAGYFLGGRLGGQEASTTAFIVLSMSQLFFALEVRTQKSLFVSGVSPFMAFATVASAALVAAVLFVPQLAVLFQLAMLPWQYYLFALLLSLLPLAASELRYAALRWQKTKVKAGKVRNFS